MPPQLRQNTAPLVILPFWSRHSSFALLLVFTMKVVSGPCNAVCMPLTCVVCGQDKPIDPKPVQLQLLLGYCLVNHQQGL
jgi:hypothetical protein